MRKGDRADRMRFERDAVQLTLFVAEPHVGDRRSKIDQLLRRAAQMGASGGTVLAAYKGFGRRHSHEPTLWHRPDETPLMVIFVDTAERLEVISRLVDEIAPDSVAVTNNVRAIQYVRSHTH